MVNPCGAVGGWVVFFAFRVAMFIYFIFLFNQVDPTEVSSFFLGDVAKSSLTTDP